ncbi:MAG: hypothetical protein WDO15_04250 [Bacteroidota bacterium]
MERHLYHHGRWAAVWTRPFPPTCLILTGLLLAVSCIRNWKFIAIANHVIVTIFIVVAAIIVVADLELYRNWGFRMDSTPLMYIGSEGAQSVSISVLLVVDVVAVVDDRSVVVISIGRKLRHASSNFRRSKHTRLSIF